MCCAPAVDFDCSGLHNARHLLNVVAHAAAQLSGYFTCTRAFSCSHAVFSCRLRQEHQHEPQLVDINRCNGAAAASAILSRLAAREIIRQFSPWCCWRCSDFIITCWCVAWAGTCVQLHFVERVLIAAGDIKSIAMSECGLNEPSTELHQHLQRFSALQHVNMSGNPLLGTAGVTAIMASLAGA